MQLIYNLEAESRVTNIGIAEALIKDKEQFGLDLYEIADHLIAYEDAQRRHPQMVEEGRTL